MHHSATTTALTALVAFGFGLAAHGVGDHWIQTHTQACTKAMDRPGCDRTRAVWACARHVLTWSATVLAFISLAGWWLALPLRPGWLAAGMTINAVTHFIADLRTPLVRIAEFLGRGGYISHVQVDRGAGRGVESTGPGTALFHLDQPWHIAWHGVSSLVMAGPPAAVSALVLA